MNTYSQYLNFSTSKRHHPAELSLDKRVSLDSLPHVPLACTDCYKEEAASR